MKLTVRKQDLQAELSLCQGVVEAKATMPVLSHVLLRAGKQGLELLGTDLEIGLETSCAADVTTPGALALPAKVLHDVVRALDSDTVSLESDARGGSETGWLKIEGGSFKGRVAGLVADQFPKQPQFPQGKGGVSVPLGVLQQMIGRTAFAVSAENTRFVINGALMKAGADGLTLVSTDGHRLAYVNRQVDAGGEINALIHRKALLEINRLKAADENEEATIALDGNYAFFRVGRRLLFSRTLDSTFPNYDKVIPHENPVTVRVDRKAFLDVINRVALLTSDTVRLIVMDFSGGSATISTGGGAASAVLGEASETIEAEQQGADVRIGLNHEYVRQFLTVLDSEKVEIKLKDSTTQALFQPAGQSGYQYVVMPMRLA